MGVALTTNIGAYHQPTALVRFIDELIPVRGIHVRMVFVETVLICRFFAGVAGAASQVLVPASVQSLYTPQEMAVPFVTAAIVSHSSFVWVDQRFGYLTEAVVVGGIGTFSWACTRLVSMRFAWGSGIRMF